MSHQKKYIRNLSMGIFISLYTLSSSVFAEQENKSMLPPSKDTFKQIDTNADAKITFDELQVYEVKRKQKIANAEADRFIKSCDKNKDGTVTLTELPNEEEMRKLDDIALANPEKLKELNSRCLYPIEFLEVMDFNEDGIISRQEMLQGVGSEKAPKKVEKKMEQKMLTKEAKRRTKQFVKCDRNLDDMLTLREAVSMHCPMFLNTERFDAFDADGDGMLSVKELAKPIKPVELEREVDPQELARRKRMPPIIRIQSALEECDKNEDDRLSKSEIVGAKCEQDLVYFDTVDHNQDGYITSEEIQRMRNKKYFDQLDKNKDGVLTAKEYKHATDNEYHE